MTEDDVRMVTAVDGADTEFGPAVLVRSDSKATELALTAHTAPFLCKGLRSMAERDPYWHSQLLQFAADMVNAAIKSGAANVTGAVVPADVATLGKVLAEGLRAAFPVGHVTRISERGPDGRIGETVSSYAFPESK